MRALLGWLFYISCTSAAQTTNTLTLAHDGHWLEIHGPQIPGNTVRINYLEAYCRAHSTDADWNKHTVIKHTCRVLSQSEDGKTIRLRDTLSDGVTVEHTITAKADEVDFQLVAHNPTKVRSEAHWAQPCIRLGDFTGFGTEGINREDYLPKCFVFLDEKLTRLPTTEWATTARYVPGQVWCPTGVPRTDVNPRPLSKHVPSNGLIGCFSHDEKMIFAVAFEPYQELFQGIIRCLHADFRLGGLQPGESKKIRGKMYIIPSDVPTLLKRYAKDFPEHGKE